MSLLRKGKYKLRCNTNKIIVLIDNLDDKINVLLITKEK
jgi:hypothetical protein